VLVLANITTALADMKVSTHQINMQNKGDTVLITLTIGARNTSHVSSIESRLRSLENVISVVRGKL
jgi:(p)ppGpp synthase/HD superfamily hydrolase